MQSLYLESCSVGIQRRERKLFGLTRFAGWTSPHSRLLVCRDAVRAAEKLCNQSRRQADFGSAFVFIICCSFCKPSQCSSFSEAMGDNLSEKLAPSVASVVPTEAFQESFNFAGGGNNLTLKDVLNKADTSAALTATGSPNNSNNGNDLEKKPAEECRACSDPKVKGSPFCASHKRGYQCIQNRCCKKNKDGSFQDPDAEKNFRAIFGTGREGPPNMTLANQVVVDFVKENPEGKDVGKKRGTVALSQYLDKMYSKMSLGRVEDDCLWDEELFINKFKQLRGWSHAYAKQKFQELKADPNTYKDDLGFGGACRVSVPSSWTGEDRQRKARDFGQEKALERGHKAVKMNDGDEVKIRSEIESAAGFTHIDPSALAAPSTTWNVPLPASAKTNLGGSSTETGAVALVAAAAGASPAEATPQSSPTKTTAEEIEESPHKQETKKTAAGQFDINRLRVARTATAAVTEHQKKLYDCLRKGWLAMEASDQALDDDLRKLLSERAQIVMHCAGVAIGQDVQPLAQGADPGSNLDLLPINYDIEDCAFSAVSTHKCTPSFDAT